MSLPSRVLEEIAERFGTPFYVYDFNAVEARVAALGATVGPRFEIAFAVKANPSLGLLTVLGRTGIGADVASRGELRTARLLSAHATCRLQRRSLFVYLTEAISAHARGDPVPLLT